MRLLRRKYFWATARHVGRRHLGLGVAVEEQKPPVAARLPLAQLHGEELAVGHQPLGALGQLGLGPLHVGLVDLRLAQLLHHVDQGVAHRLGRRTAVHLRHHLEDAGVVQRPGVGADAAGLLRLDQRLVEGARRLQVEHRPQHFQRREVRVGGGGDVVDESGHADRADAAQHHVMIAVLGRLLGPGRRQDARRLRDRGVVLDDQAERLFRIEIARDEQHDVIGLIPLVVEGLQVLDRHALDVAAVANGGLRVVVPLVGGRHHALVEDVLRRVLAALELVAHHRHLGGQVFVADEAVDEPVGFEVEGEVEVVVRGVEGLEVVGAVERGGGVELGAVVAQVFRDLRVFRRALEVHVFEQVGHAGLAVALHARSDEDGLIDGDLGRRRIGEENDAESVVEMVFRDTLDGDDLLRGGGRLGGQAGRRQRGKEGEGGRQEAGRHEPEGHGGSRHVVRSESR